MSVESLVRLGASVAWVAGVAGVAALAVGCSKSSAGQTGLMVIVRSDLDASALDSIEVQVSQEVSPGQWHLWFDRQSAVPDETALPTTVLIESGKSTDQDVLIRVVATKGGAPVVLREVQIQAPTNRLAELRLVLSPLCAGQVAESGEGGVVSTCSVAGESCQPDTGQCGPDIVADPQSLPTYVPGDENLDAGDNASAEAGVAVSADAGADATLADAASGPDDAGVADAEAGEVDCGDTAASGDNCGACGHSCLGGACEAGVCRPVQVALDPNHPNSIAVDDTHVYWTDQMGSVLFSGLDGGIQSTLFNGSLPGNGGGAQAVAVGATYVCWACPAPPEGIRCMAKVGGPLITVAGSYIPFNLVVDGSNVYWASYPTECAGTLQGAPIPPQADGGQAAPLQLLPSGAPYGFFLYGSDYVASFETGCRGSNTETISRGPLDGGAATTLYSHPPTNDAGMGFTFGLIASAGNLAYWVDSSGNLTSYDLLGTQVTAIATGVTFMGPNATGFQMIADEAFVYFANQTGVYGQPVAGGARRTISAGGMPAALAQDATALYWVEPNAGAVMKVAK